MRDPSDELKLAIDRLRGEGWDDSADVVLDLFVTFESMNAKNVMVIQRLRDCRAARKRQ